MSEAMIETVQDVGSGAGENLDPQELAALQHSEIERVLAASRSATYSRSDGTLRKTKTSFAKTSLIELARKAKDNDLQAASGKTDAADAPAQQAGQSDNADEQITDDTATRDIDAAIDAIEGAAGLSPEVPRAKAPDEGDETSSEDGDAPKSANSEAVSGATADRGAHAGLPAAPGDAGAHDGTHDEAHDGANDEAHVDGEDEAKEQVLAKEAPTDPAALPEITASPETTAPPETETALDHAGDLSSSREDAPELAAKFEEGVAAGRRQAEEELGALVTQMTQIIDQLQTITVADSTALNEEIRLAILALAEQRVGRAIDEMPESFLARIYDLVGMVDHATKNCTLVLHPEDLALMGVLSDSYPEFAHIRFKGDGELQRGDVMVQAGAVELRDLLLERSSVVDAERFAEIGSVMRTLIENDEKSGPIEIDAEDDRPTTEQSFDETAALPADQPSEQATGVEQPIDPMDESTTAEDDA